VKTFLQKALQETFDWLLPPACQLCGETLIPSSVIHLCQPCRERFPKITSPRCPHCLLPHATPAGADYPCEECLRNPLPTSQVVALGSYQEGLREAIHRFKFRGGIGLSRPFGELLASSLAEGKIIPDSIVPVPLHGRRLRRRGYNQSHLIARELQRSLGGVLEKRLLVRSQETLPQQELPLSERRRNVRGAFMVTRKLGGESILLVDDVLTTGATVRGCAEVLRKAGAADIVVAVLARAPRPGGDNLSEMPIRG